MMMTKIDRNATPAIFKWRGTPRDTFVAFGFILKLCDSVRLYASNLFGATTEFVIDSQLCAIRRSNSGAVLRRLIACTTQ